MLLVYFVFLGLVTHSLGGGNKPPDCQQAPKCGKNEVYVVDSNACIKTCANRDVVDSPYAGACIPHTGCVCKNGYMRLNDDATGPCVKENQCPPKCGKNEVYVVDSNACIKTCANRDVVDSPYAGACKPHTGCVCKNGYMRLNDDATGPCVMENQCPKDCRCGKNEVYKKERTKCPPQSCKSLYIKYRCAPTDPEPGCDCVKGYLRNNNGTCIPEKKCPPRPMLPKCCKNEVATYDRIVCPPQTCESIYALYKCDSNREPEPGCDCIKGYLRDRNGVCIKSEKCPGRKPVCGENEVPTDDRITCPPQSCESMYTKYMCAPKGDPEPGCNCKDGYLRDKNGVCIPSKQCPGLQPICGENEVATKNRIVCPPQTCESLFSTFMCEKRDPEPGCDCIDSYLRDKNGVCIPSDQCPTQPSEQCGYNEVWSQTKLVCPPQTCESQYVNYPCAYFPPQPGCVCIDNHLRNSSGICIPKEKCPPPPQKPKGCNGDPNATMKKCPNPCPPSCDNPKPIGRCAMACVDSGCECNPGYVRNSNGTCVLPKDCPAKGCNGDPNATMKKCPNPCAPTCDNPNPSGVCNKACLATGCECNSGYVRNSNGICVLPKDCPVKGCNGDPNATMKKCPNPCAPTCDNPNPSGVCNKLCLVTGCECNPGYIRSSNGTCVLPKDCPGGVKCPENEQFAYCKVDCPNNYCAVNDIRAILICDPARPCPSGCVCIGGYLRKSSKDKRCIKASECPPVNCTRPNEVWNPNPPVCLRDRCEDVNNTSSDTCNQPNRNLRPQCVCKDGHYRNESDICVPANQCPFVCPISAQCRPTCAIPNPKNCPAVEPAKSNIDGCQCQEGYILSEAEGKCIRVEDCPRNQGCNGDANAVVTSCARSCPSTCSQPNARICSMKCTVGCECANGYILSEEKGKCIKLDDCPGGHPCGQNETFVGCAIRCPIQYCPKDNRNLFYGCDPPYPCPTGCACKSEYKRLNTEDRCVLSSDCPFICPVDEQCRPTCDNPSPKNCPSTLPAEKNIDGCQCTYGYILSKAGGKCIRVEECPQNQGCEGDPHAVVRSYVWPCRATCGQPSTASCNKESVPYGCECDYGYILDKDNGKCIKVENCPGGDPCAPNATFSTFINSCPGGYCLRELTRVRYPCDPVLPTPAGCVCKSDYLRLYDGDQRCVLSSDCPPVCPVYEDCRPTCANPKPGNGNYDEFCPEVEPSKTNVDGCQCQDGYILESPGGKCIKIEECPQNQGCGGDPHAIVKYCPTSCPQTCSDPEIKCVNKKCSPPGCVCAPGYILSETYGKCILPGECKGGDPCGPNATYSSCSYRCPENFCPADDSRNGPVCDIIYPCPPGCMCKINHKRLNYTDDRCIVSSDCPPVNCTRQNEVWSSCPSECRSEYCESVNDPPTICNTLLLNCQPKCICAKGFYRNSTTDLCVPAKECSNYNNNPCSSKCTPTCAEPNPLCETAPDNRCCEEGYILSEKNGKCIRIGECPRDAGCGGDAHAIVKECPDPCPPTCDQPETIPCKKACKAVGCECAPGYLKSAIDGKCIKATECPCGDPCGVNRTFVSCAFGCPNQYCRTTDSPFQVACMPPYNCRAGCACKSNYKKLSVQDKYKCILGSECPPVNCTRQNEVWSPCPSACLRENCRDVNNQPSVCNTLVYNCDARCICKDGYYRNNNAICVPAKECEGYVNPCDSKCAPTCAEPNPPNCDKPVTGCCADGYILSERGGKCIKIEECARDIGCNGDPHAEVKKCPAPCPSTCDHPNQIQCYKACEPVGCECSSGYLKSSKGKCIKADECPGGDPCGPNGTYVDCGFRCPNQYCPKDDSQVKVACKPPRPCPPGCACKPNYKRLSYDDDRCVLATDCPPVKCTRQNEVWSSCPSECRSEYCESVNDTTTTCNTLLLNCEPRCICAKGFCRNSTTELCVPAKECSNNNNPCLSKCTPTCAVPNPPCETAPDNRCCKDGYILSKPHGRCIRICECPKNAGCNGDPNAVVIENPNPCPPTCDNRKPGPCNKTCKAVGCECAAGYIKSTIDGKCIKVSECPANHTDPCLSKCTPTCAVPNPTCETAPDNRCCADGYILSEKNGKCIRIGECPRDAGCGGDLHAIVKECPDPCPPTCDQPETNPCKKACKAVGCECAPGYIKSAIGGKCIKATECSCGDPCGVNRTFVSCVFDCPNQYCRTTDSPFEIACSPPYNCRAGCACKFNYKKLSVQDNKCILGSECPPLNCTRQNEVWSPCPSACLRENCRDVNNQPSTCNTLIAPNCDARCICKDGFYRNDSAICVPAKECEGYVNPCDSKCAPTCAEPNPPNCDKPVTGCCADGYILSERGGKCIKIEECPRDIGCNGDPHAEVKKCPAACPSTCDHPDKIECPKVCETVGCECSSGYIKSSKGGKCIKADECPGGDPCGPNGTYVDCGFRCPNQYCPQDDSQIQIACKPGRPCPPGCGCKLNYKRLSYDDDRCILAPDCPPVECTRPNEVWSPCPSACLAENCENVNDPPSVCYTLVWNCDPNCICQEGYYRNKSGICIPAQECEGFNACQSKCTPTCAVPNPPNCANPPQKPCCENGYILSEWNGTCIKIEDCPRKSCNGDPNAIVKQCPAPCPSTCSSPNAFPCKRACLAVGCECAPGYLYNEDGQCVKPTECPGGNPCGQNEVFVPCKGSCSTDYCPMNDNRGNDTCSSPNPCLSGCICRVNHKRKSYDDPQCIVASDCPPVDCTRQNECWDSCPSPCLQESCDDVGKKPVICNTLVLNCQPRCVCTKNHYRNGTDICVTPEECKCQ